MQLLKFPVPDPESALNASDVPGGEVIPLSPKLPAVYMCASDVCNVEELASYLQDNAATIAELNTLPPTDEEMADDFDTKLRAANIDKHEVKQVIEFCDTIAATDLPPLPGLEEPPYITLFDAYIELPRQQAKQLIRYYCSLHGELKSPFPADPLPKHLSLATPRDQSSHQIY